jgi:5-methylcytosine-specific restriction endonuclease McrA
MNHLEAQHALTEIERFLAQAKGQVLSEVLAGIEALGRAANARRAGAGGRPPRNIDLNCVRLLSRIGIVRPSMIAAALGIPKTVLFGARHRLDVRRAIREGQEENSTGRYPQVAPVRGKALQAQRTGRVQCPVCHVMKPARDYYRCHGELILFACKACLSRKYAARSRMVTSVGSYSVRDWMRLVNRYRGCCAYCGKHGNLTADHCIPVSRGGSNYIGNILPACMTCNSSKNARTIMEWRLWKERRAAA